jgi:hypothetical protein
VSVPLGFLAAIVAALMTSDPAAEASFHELTVRANTGSAPKHIIKQQDCASRNPSRVARHLRLLAEFAALVAWAASPARLNLRSMFGPSRAKLGTTASADFCPFSCTLRCRFSSVTRRRQISPGKNVDFLRMSPPHLRLQLLVVSDFALACKLVQLQAPDTVRIPQRTDLPPASFGFHLAMNTLALG